jgi:hypothetical protein
MRAFLRIVLFVVIGPPIGTFAMIFTSSLPDLARTGSPDGLMYAATQLFHSLDLIEFGYVMGGLPALIAGIVASALPRVMTTGWAYRAWVTLSGALASAVVIFAFLGASSMGVSAASNLANAAGFLGLMAWTGAVAAFSCTLIFEGLSHTAVRTRAAA